MKKIITSGVALLLVLLTFSLNAQNLTTISFKNTEIDFGQIKEDGGIVTRDFVFTNTGKTPLILSSVTASCGCTTPVWPKEPILPGKGGVIKVSYDPLNRPGAFNKTVSVVANIQQGVIVLKISGEVLQKPLTIDQQYPSNLGKLRFLTNNLSFVRVKNNEIKKDSLKFINASNEQVKIGFKGVVPHLQVKAVPEVVAPNKTGYIVVTYDGSKVNDFGFQMHRFYITYNGVEDYNNGLNITATIEEDFSKLSSQELANSPRIDFDKMVYDFGEIKMDAKVEYSFKIFNRGKSDLKIRSVKASCGCTAANPASNVIKPGESTSLNVLFDSKGKLGLQNKTITIHSNDPNNPAVVLRVTGNVGNAQ